MTTDPHELGSEWVDPDHTGMVDDEWHDHSGERPPTVSHGTTSPMMIFLVGVVGFVLIVAAVLVITQYFKIESQRELSAKQEVALSGEARAKQAEWDAKLSGYEWVDAERGVVRIPLETAMDKIAREYAQAQ